MSGAIHPLFNITGKVALVTGGGSGIGREFCDVLAEFGADVICLDQFKDRAVETCGLIQKHGHKTLPLTVDVSQYDQVHSAFQQVMASFGKLDILINDAGIAPPTALIDETEIRYWQKVIDVDLSGVFYCLKEGLGIMRRQNSGVVVNVSSNLGISAVYPDVLAQSPYVAAKHGVIGLTKQAAAEYGQFNIRVNCIAPGFHVGTKIPESLGNKAHTDASGERKKLLSSRTPLGRVAEARDLRGLLIYLVSDSSSYTTGATVVSDGGWTVW